MSKRHHPHAFIRSVQRRVDELVTRIRRVAAAQGQPVVCRDGCAWCCDEPVYAITDEAALLADRVRAMPEAQRQAVLERLRTACTTLAASPLYAENEPHAVAYRRLKLTCPLLIDSRCSVYSDRPMGCRMHLARKPAEPFCSDLEHRTEQHFIDTTLFSLAPIASVVQAQGQATYDHLILLLANELLGDTWASGSATKIVADYGDRPRWAPRKTNAG